MNKFQNVSFKSVEDFLDYIPKEELVVVEVLRKNIMVLPDIREKLSFNVPFYSRHKNICHIWPSSIPWGGLKTGDGVSIGFANGRLLYEAGFELDLGKRKNIGTLLYTSIATIDIPELEQLLFAAYEIDRGLLRIELD